MPGTTTNFGFPYPLDTDALADGAQEIQNLADDLDTTLVDLKGGTSGQYLAKNSNTDMDFVWSTVTLPAVPTPSSTYYFSNINNHAGGTIAASTGGALDDVVQYVPIMIGEDMTIDRIGIEVTTALAASTIRLGLYTESAGAPGTLIADFGTVSSATTGLKELTVSQAVSKGRVFAAWKVDSSTTTVNVRRISGGWNLAQFVSTQADALDPNDVHWRQTGVTGALPATATATLTSTGSAFSNGIITLRRA